jgi:MoxR-like ATPase
MTQALQQVPQSQVEEARGRVKQLIKTLSSRVIGRDEDINMLLTAVIARENAVMIGPPGTAKTMLITMLAKLLGARAYTILLTRFTGYEDVFGPVDILKLTKGVYERKWSKIVEAEFIFLDEIFKANAAILNSLLSLLQERVIYDPMSGVPKPVNAWSVFGASNEVPEDPELQALYDRFPVRVFVNYLDDPGMYLTALAARWVGSDGLEPVASMGDVKVLNDYAVSLITAKVEELGAPVYRVYNELAVPFLIQLRSKGVMVSDRTIIEKGAKLYAAYLVLNGFDIVNAYNAIYKLAPYFAKDIKEHAEVKKAIEEARGKIGELAAKLDTARSMAASGNLAEAKKVLEDLITNTNIDELSRTAPYARPEVEAILKEANELLETVKKYLNELKGARWGERK